jgi:urease accessory protein
MLIVEHILGNRLADTELAGLCAAAEKEAGLELVHLSYADAQRGRMLVTTDAGRQIGVSIGRDGGLRDGDVLYRSPDGRRIIAVEVELPEVMAIRIPTGLGELGMFEAGVRLGHLLGNQHWPITLREGKVVVAVTVDRLVMETVLRHHAVEGLEHEFEAIEPDGLAVTQHEPHEHV